MSRSKILFFVAAVAALPAAGLRAQAPAAGVANPTFDVASIKPNTTGDGRSLIEFPPGGRFTATGITLRMLIAMAYGTPQPLSNSRIIGGPGWLGSDRFDIVAKTDSPVTPGPNGSLPLMLRALLADRLKLAAHNESREMPIYALVKARRDGKLGPQLQPSAVDCAAIAAARGRGGAPPAPADPGGPASTGRGPGAGGRGPGFDAAGRPICGTMVGPANITGGGQDMSQLATILSGRVDRPVVDRTGLTGRFDITLTWTPDQLRDFKPSADLPSGTLPLVNGVPFDPNGPSIFTAVQEQLGLKLESTKGPVDVVVIDRAEQPAED
jgi:bla regulator protein blaR1